MFQNADPIVLFRMFERMTLTVAVIIVAVVIMIGFWRSVQKIDLTQGGSLGITGSFVLSTPVFALLTIVGYAYVSLSHPIRVDPGAPAAGGEQVAAASNGGGQFLGASRPQITSNNIGRERALAQGRVRSLNCLTGGRDISARLEDDVVETKLELLAPVWDEAWGGFDPFSSWARGLSTDTPNALARTVFEERHVVC